MLEIAISLTTADEDNIVRKSLQNSLSVLERIKEPDIDEQCLIVAMSDILAYYTVQE